MNHLPSRAGTRAIAGGLAALLALTVLNTWQTGAALAAGPVPGPATAPADPSATVPAVPPATADPSTAGGAGPVAPDEPSARLTARLTGKRVEVESARTETATTYANPDGSLTVEAFAGPIRFRRDGRWAPVDISLTTAPDGEVVTRGHRRGLRFGGRGVTRRGAEAVDLITLGEGDAKVTLQWKGSLPAPRIAGESATYPEALPGADLVVSATRTGAEQFLLLDRAPDRPLSYSLKLKAPGMRPRQTADGGVELTGRAGGRAGGEVVTIPAPVMWDARVDPGSGEHRHRAKVDMRLSGDELVLTPDPAFLSDPATVYPVTVDPSLNLGQVFDTFVQEGYGTDQSGATELKVGDNGGGQVARSFITWKTPGIAGKKIQSATLNLWNFHSWSCEARSWEVWTANRASTSSRWPGPALAARYATSSQTKGWGTGCADGWVNANVTSLAQHWADNGWTESGIGLRATSETDEYAWKRFNSGNASSHVPYIAVTYNSYPTKPPSTWVTPGAAYDAVNWTTTVTPQLQAHVGDADGGNVRGLFDVYDGTTLVVDNLLGGYVASGKFSAATVPAGKLVPGRTYTVRAWSNDGSLSSTAYATHTFTVDTAKPPVPTVSSADYPADGTWHGGAGKAGTFTVKPASTDTGWIAHRLDGGAIVKVLTTGAAKQVVVTPATTGAHTFQAYTIDKAGNASPTVTHNFNVGSGTGAVALVSPADGRRSTGQVGLAATGGGFDRATFQWRRAEIDAWADIPVAHVLGADGRPLAAWPVPVTVAGGTGTVSGLTWNLSGQLGGDGAAQVRAVLSTAGGVTGTSEVADVVADRRATGAAADPIDPGAPADPSGSRADADPFAPRANEDRAGQDEAPGGTAPAPGSDSSSAPGSAPGSGSGSAPGSGSGPAPGPGAVNLLTGDHVLRTTEAAEFGLSLSRTASSRDPELGARVTGLVAPFGPQWSVGGASPYASLRETSASSAELLLADGTPIQFTRTASGWKPERGAEELTLTGTYTLRDPRGSVTTFTKQGEVYLPGGHLYETVDGRSRLKAITSAGGCSLPSPVVGCRVLELVYATTTTASGTVLGDQAGRVSEVLFHGAVPGAAAGQAVMGAPVAIARYAYDAAGRLRETWDPRIVPALKTAYGYDAAGRVVSLTPPGELPWTYRHDTDGRLLAATRSTLRPGTADQIAGEATTSLVYGVPLGKATGGPADLLPAHTAVWGQRDNPVTATAIFPADQRPASNTGAQATWSRATVSYLNADGRAVNTLVPGGHLSVAEYDRSGHAVRELTAHNRALALDEENYRLAELAITQFDAPERAELLSTRSVYDDTGRRELERIGPVHIITLEADVPGAEDELPAGYAIGARTRTVTTYDEGRPADAVTRDLATTVRVGARIVGRERMPDTDVRTTTIAYDWAVGRPARVVRDPGGLAITTGAAYNAAGGVTRTTRPKGAGVETTYYESGGSGTCAGRPEWAGLTCQEKPVGNAGSVRTFTHTRFGDRATVTESAGGVTTTGYDAAGRPVTTLVTGGVGQPLPTAGVLYDPGTGRVLEDRRLDGTGTVTERVVTAYDRLGRVLSVTDADGGTTRTEYDALGRRAKVVDSAPSTVTYAYDHAAEPRGLVTSVTDSVAGVFTARYDEEGVMTTGDLPGGLHVMSLVDEVGAEFGRIYTRDDLEGPVMIDQVSASVHGQTILHLRTDTMTDRTLGYDAAGRLSSVQEYIGLTCAVRAYSFDANTNRSRLAAHSSDEDCPRPDDPAATVTTYAHDAADRLTGDGYGYDALGRTTSLPGGRTVNYHVNGVPYRQTAGSSTMTWALDARNRIRSATSETGTVKVSHYGSGDDRPSWIVEDTRDGEITRNVVGPDGRLAAITAKAGPARLQLTTVHGDVGTELELGTGAATVLDYDEYGVARSEARRYGWLGGLRRSAETVDGTVLMGARLYDPALGRYLQPVVSAADAGNPYESWSADPVNHRKAGSP
ncbi:DNRLRE domain-containing protein [Streptosporangium sp. NBC_01495]|uniref:DNRLRE domain-containing protein n=1 Tax=Streptosporangium sp. NBC_01495 TaxID=2903899 RepID=UPI002E31E32C|nr:DNRLRE domain-containing protein [Streptosporangium sp. NBC_01495]